MPPRSLLLLDALLSVLEQGAPVSARKAAKLMGDDAARVQSELRALAHKGVVKCRVVTPKNPKSRPYDLFAPRPTEVAKLIESRKGVN